VKEEYGMAEKLERPDGVFTRRQFSTSPVEPSP